MRLVPWAGIGLILLLLAYCAWPLVDAAKLADAARRGDAAAVMQRVDLPDLRISLARQVVLGYMKQSGRYQKLGSYGRELAQGLGTSIADSFLETLLTPDSIMTLLQGGSVAPVATVEGVQLPRLGDAFRVAPLRLIMNAYFNGLTRFVVVLDRGSEEYGVRLRLVRGRWLLSGIDIPPALTARLASDVAARQKATGQTTPP